MGNKSKNQKGCPMCKYHKDHRVGRSLREPWNVRRYLGKDRRITRNQLPKEAEE